MLASSHFPSNFFAPVQKHYQWGLTGDTNHFNERIVFRARHESIYLVLYNSVSETSCQACVFFSRTDHLENNPMYTTFAVTLSTIHMPRELSIPIPHRDMISALPLGLGRQAAEIFFFPSFSPVFSRTFPSFAVLGGPRS
jgi:hypothetical protein